jgi:rhomboid family GlyGly-CTERM serine protease
MLNGFTMLNLPLSPRFTIGPSILLVLCWGLFLFEPMSSEWLAYDRNLIEQQQIWRLLTGNFLHTNFNHLLLNCAGLILLWALHGQYFKTKQYLLFMTVLCLGTTLSVYAFSPQLRWYVGLSGALHGLFLLGAYFDIKHGLKSGWLLIIGVLVKVAHEQYYGASDDIAELIGANVAIDAHLYGCLSALLLISILWFTTRRVNTDIKVGE